MIVTDGVALHTPAFSLVRGQDRRSQDSRNQVAFSSAKAAIPTPLSAANPSHSAIALADRD